MPPTGKRRSLIGRKRRAGRKAPVNAQEDRVEAQESEDTLEKEESETGAPRRAAPPTPPVNPKMAAIGVVAGLALIGGIGAFGLFFGAGFVAVVAGSAGEPEEAMVTAAEPIPEVALAPEVVEDVEEEVEDEVLAEPEVAIDAAAPDAIEAVDEVTLPAEPANARPPRTTIMRVETKAERRERKKKKRKK